MAINLAQEAIAVLLDLAQRGEIDPWDVQVIEVIDRYLSKLALTGDLEPGKETADLPQSGQAFLWASMLVLLKANTLDEVEEEPEDEEIGEFDSDDLARPERALPTRLERHIRRRPSAPPLRRRRVTLQELIEQIEAMAVVLESKPAKPRVRSRSPSRREALRTIAELAHNENLTEMAGLLDQFLSQNFQQIAGEQEKIALDQLVAFWSQQQGQSSPSQPSTHDRVGVFWALLLLSAQSKVELEQQEFYQDLTIKPISP
ncbi:segregation/condensation protein A [Spirulina subsalsa FACHB-351]|uniref:Segregation and condensation protein A n=1 Tax=Spirulina subsalsa FACHB-351 TaxID=234711 RepID=A0ABT3L631_9CYAN|nr:segregation/condensation protein A [Spirulina subsalsa]MCW6036976.1 segregation/condensation protein A [Spirulina subsalsa FACHB-351]